MKKIIVLLPAILLLSFTYTAQHDAFKQLSALAGGTWQMKTSKGLICERWTKTGSNEMQSQGFRIKGKDTIPGEEVKLVQRENGVFYIPTVKDQNQGKAVVFKLTSGHDQLFIFENPEHDFPQRIAYQFIAQDSLHAWVDGNYKGKFVKEDYFYKRVR